MRPETGSFACHTLRRGLPLRRRAVNPLARRRAICLCPPTTPRVGNGRRGSRSRRRVRSGAQRIGAASQANSEMYVATPQTARDFQPVATAASGSTMRAGRERSPDTEFHIMREARGSMRTRSLVLPKWQRCRCCGTCSFMASKDTQLSCPTVRSKCSHRTSVICVPLQGTNAVPTSLRRLLELQIEGGPVVRV
jgi:hypothetical protein